MIPLKLLKSQAAGLQTRTPVLVLLGAKSVNLLQLQDFLHERKFLPSPELNSFPENLDLVEFLLQLVLSGKSGVVDAQHSSENPGVSLNVAPDVDLVCEDVEDVVFPGFDQFRRNQLRLVEFLDWIEGGFCFRQERSLFGGVEVRSG